MGDIFRNWRISAAALFSVVIIAGAYALAKDAERPPVAQASTEAELLRAIAMKDSTGDGLPDWEKTLYGIPLNATTTDYFHLGMTDGEAVAKGLIVPKAIADLPASVQTAGSRGLDYASAGLTPPAEGSLTDAFSKSFFTYYIAAKQQNAGRDLSTAEIQSIADRSLQALSTSITLAPDFKSAEDILASGSGREAMRAYAAAAEGVLKKNPIRATMSEAGYLQAAIEKNDTKALASLAELAKTYRGIGVGLSALAVPPEIASTHLAIVNAVIRLSEIDNDFSRVNIDPLGAMYALQQYPEAETQAEQAFAALADAYAKEGVVFKKGEAGSAYVNLIRNLGKRP